jgi:hypothetical protein
MDDAFARGFAQISHRDAELDFGGGGVALLNNFAKLANFRSHTSLHAPVAGALLDILTITLDC